MYNGGMLVSKNKKAYFEGEVLEKYMAGIVLKGYEVKALKEGKVNFDSSYVQFIGNELFVVNMYIGRFTNQSQEVSEQSMRRSRKLLLNQREIEQVRRDLQERGKTVVPLAMLLEHNLIKLEFGIMKGRKKTEKKHIEKEKQIKRDLERDTKEFRRANSQ